MPARLPVLLALLLLLALPAAAAADPKPIPKPEATTVTPPAKPPAVTTPVQAVSPPAKRQTPPARTSTPPAATGSTSTDATKPADTVTKPEKIVVVTVEGIGRDQSAVPPPVIPPPDPTPLALVAASEPAPSDGGATPAWKLALLALLAAAEAFLVVRLVRHGPTTLSPAQ